MVLSLIRSKCLILSLSVCPVCFVFSAGFSQLSDAGNLQIKHEIIFILILINTIITEELDDLISYKNYSCLFELLKF